MSIRRQSDGQWALCWEEYSCSSWSIVASQCRLNQLSALPICTAKPSQKNEESYRGTSGPAFHGKRPFIPPWHDTSPPRAHCDWTPHLRSDVDPGHPSMFWVQQTVKPQKKVKITSVTQKQIRCVKEPFLEFSLLNANRLQLGRLARFACKMRETNFFSDPILIKLDNIV